MLNFLALQESFYIMAKNCAKKKGKKNLTTTNKKKKF